MNNVLIQFIRKLDTLPEEVKFFHSSNLSNSYIEKLAQKYQVDKEIIFQAMTEIIANDFDFDVLDNMVFNIENEDALRLDIIGYLFLPIDQYIEKISIADEIRKRKGDVLAYGIIISELIDAIENEKDGLINIVIGNFDKAVNLKEERETIFGFIGTDLVNLLKDETDAINCINATLINLLFNDKNFKEEISRTLFVNGELLTHAPFEMEGHPQSPTIGNWIQDFIQYNGSGMFTNLALTKYITDSDNAKRLAPEEKRLVQKLLQLYRNIKFFPESLSNVPVEDWEIIPANKESQNVEVRKPIGRPMTEEEKRIEALKREEEEFSAGGLERLAIEEEIQGNKKLEDLKIEMNKYPVGSLERMVVEEEARKLES